jgi:hypothetical protein
LTLDIAGVAQFLMELGQKRPKRTGLFAAAETETGSILCCARRPPAAITAPVTASMISHRIMKEAIQSRQALTIQTLDPRFRVTFAGMMIIWQAE